MEESFFHLFVREFFSCSSLHWTEEDGPGRRKTKFHFRIFIPEELWNSNLHLFISFQNENSGSFCVAIFLFFNQNFVGVTGLLQKFYVDSVFFIMKRIS